MSKEIRRQKIYVPKASKRTLQELAVISQKIEERGLPDFLVRRKLPENLGYGIFLHPKAEAIRSGSVIASYGGKVSLFAQNESDDSDYAFAPIGDITLSRKEHALMGGKRRYHPRRLYCVDLDAAKTGNFTRFINHSSEPNIEAHFIEIPKNALGLDQTPAEIVYIAKKKIQPGEQLLVCYEDEEKSYWGALGIKPFPMTASTFRLSSQLKVCRA